jgi:CheY-like chemotaxis protein
VETGPKLWLQIEPDPAAAQLVQIILAERRPGIRLVTCDSGEQALAWLRRDAAIAALERPDLIMTALRLPDYEPADLIRAMREAPLASGVPVLVWSPEVHWPKAERQCLAVGASAVLHQSMDLEAFTGELLGWAEPLKALSQHAG